MNKLSKKNVIIIFSMLISFIAGLHMVIDPESVNNLVIRTLGVICIIEGFSYGFKLIEMYIKIKINK